MISAYAANQDKLVRTVAPNLVIDGAVWIDLYEPTADEESLLERTVKFDVPTREEMEEIEISSRLYIEDDTAFMTATLPSHTDGDDPQLAPVTFALTGNRLVTIRYHEPRAFRSPPQRIHRLQAESDGAAMVLTALLETQIDRLADVLERIARDINQISREVFRARGRDPLSGSDFQSVIGAIGHKGDSTSNMLECLVSLERLFGFLNYVAQQRDANKELRSQIRTLSRDCRSLIEHADSLTHKVTFLLDATLGLINIEQNAIIKIFSVAAVAFLPPTLIASIYGMNFSFIPELKWPFGYPFALVLMIGSAVLPYWYFKRRRWL
jgi:magnesium transporter